MSESTEWLSLGIIVLVGLTNPFSPLLSNGDYGLAGNKIEAQGIADERAVYYQSTGLLKMDRGVQMPNHPWALEGQKLSTQGPNVFLRNTIGFIGFFAGPDTHIVDNLALGDAFLARLPTFAQRWWRIGHFPRAIPQGYMESLSTGRNLIEDKNLALFYEKMTLITRGRLNDPDRLIAIWEMNLGRYDYLIDKEFYRRYATRVSISEISAAPAGASAWNDPGNFSLDAGGLLVDLLQVRYDAQIEMRLYNDENIELTYYARNAVIAKQVISPSPNVSGQLVLRTVDVLPNVAEKGYDMIGVTLPFQRAGSNYSIGQLRLVSDGKPLGPN